MAVLQGCEKLLRTPCAPGYVGVLRCAMFALLSLLPFLVLELSFGTIPIVVATGFVLLVAEDLAVQLEVPFGDDANDLPLRAYCLTIFADVFDIFDEHMGKCAPSSAPTSPGRSPRALLPRGGASGRFASPCTSIGSEVELTGELEPTMPM